MTDDKIRVLVVDDTVTYRKILSRVIEALPNVELLGTATNGVLALEKIAQDRPDLVLCDVMMPKMDGITTLENIREKYPEIGVVMVSSANREHADITVQALKKGALDFVPKPSGGDLESNYRELREKLKPIISLFITRQYTSEVRRLMPGDVVGEPEKPVRKPPRIKIGTARKSMDLVCIGVSTGGPRVLNRIFLDLRYNPHVPILVVQHMPPVFTASLAEHLDRITDFRVCEARSGEMLEPGVVYIAPGGKHMEVAARRAGTDYILKTTNKPPVHSCRPSVDVLFNSVADNYEGRCLALVLTGMGSDGRDGAAALKGKGAYCIAQDEESSVVFGMPKAVIENDCADEILPAEVIAERINALVKKD